MFKLLSFCLFFAVATQSFGGNPKSEDKDNTTISYVGKVLDVSSLEALTGASVRIVELDKMVYADFEGNFVFEGIPAGTYTLEISYLSYLGQTLENVEISSSKKSKSFLLSAI